MKPLLNSKSSYLWFLTIDYEIFFSSLLKVNDEKQLSKHYFNHIAIFKEIQTSRNVIMNMTHSLLIFSLYGKIIIIFASDFMSVKLFEKSHYNGNAHV